MSTNEKNYIGFTLDCRKLGNIIAQDPTALAELVAGVREVTQDKKPIKLTEKLGAANLSGGDGDAADWYGLFVSTVRGKEPGDKGLFWRNNSKGGDGTRIQMRLRQQKKTQQAATTPANTEALTPASALGALMAKMGLTPEQVAAVASMATAPAAQADDDGLADIAAAAL